jgi:iron complex transport system substrate-binding protein
MRRIASLLPSTTEIACAVGLESMLVGRSHECDHPPGVGELPVLTAAKLDSTEPSRAIDARVRQLVEEGLSVYRVDSDQLRALSPDLILTQDQCEVCAASLRDVERALEDWLGTPPQVVSLNPQTLGDVWNDVRRVATAAGEGARGDEVADALIRRVDALTARMEGTDLRPSVACVEWIEPLMAAGNWMPELIERAGGRNLFGENGRHSPWLEWSALRDADPDVIVVLPCGFDLERVRAEMGPLVQQPGWSGLRAVREGRVVLTDGNQYFNRPGPRLVESLEILCEILHPEIATPRSMGRAWERF